MSASFISTSSFSVPKGANRASGAGFFSELIKSIDTWMAASAEQIPGIMVLSVNNSNESEIRSALLLKM